MTGKKRSRGRSRSRSSSSDRQRHSKVSKTSADEHVSSKSKRSRSASSDRSASCSSKKAAATGKSKKKHRSRSSSSSASDSCKNNAGRTKEKKHKKSEKKKRKKEKKKLKKKMKKEKRKEKKVAEVEIVGPTVELPRQVEDEKNKLEDPGEEPTVDRAKAMAPMTKEEWEKRQSVIRRVYDEETGRHRLIKGDGEVLEEIVSRDRHKEINKQATKGDGDFFQATLTAKLRK